MKPQGRKKKGFLEYYVAWKGYNAAFDSWEHEDNLERAQAMIKDFKKRHPGAVQRIDASVFASLPWQKLENFTEGPTNEFAWEEGRYFPRVIEDDEC